MGTNQQSRFASVVSNDSNSFFFTSSCGTGSYTFTVPSDQEFDIEPKSPGKFRRSSRSPSNAETRRSRRCEQSGPVFENKYGAHDGLHGACGARHWEPLP